MVPILSVSCQHVGAQYYHVRMRMQTDLDEVKATVDSRFDGDFDRYLVHLHKLSFSRSFEFHEVNLQPYYCNPILVYLLFCFHFCSVTLLITKQHLLLRLMMMKRSTVARPRLLRARLWSPLSRLTMPTSAVVAQSLELAFVVHALNRFAPLMSRDLEPSWLAV